MSWKTRPICRAFDDRRKTGPWFNSWRVSRLTAGRPGLSGPSSRLTTVCHTFSCQSFFFNMATALLSSFVLDLLLSCSDGVRMSTFHHFCNHSWSCRTSILEDAIFHRMNWCKFLWGNPCRATETFYHGLFPVGLRVLDVFLSLCCMKEFGDGFGCVIFARLWISWRKLQLSPLEHCPLASHCQQSPIILCPRFFDPLILDHGGVFLKISISAPKILISSVLLDTSFYHSLQSVIIRSHVLLMSLQIIQFQYGLEFLRLQYS